MARTTTIIKTKLMDELFEALENTNKSNLPTGFVDWLKQPGNLDVMEKFLTETNKNIKSIQLRKAADARKQYEEFCPALVIVTAKVNQGAYGLLVNSNIPNYDPKHYSIDTTTRYGTTPGSLRSILQIHKENKKNEKMAYIPNNTICTNYRISII